MDECNNGRNKMVREAKHRESDRLPPDAAGWSLLSAHVTTVLRQALVRKSGQVATCLVPKIIFWRSEAP